MPKMPAMRVRRWRPRLRDKLLLAFALTSLLLIGVLALVLRFGFQRGFLDYLARLDLERIEPLAVGLEDYYARHGQWRGLREEPWRWHELHRLIAPPDGMTRPPEPPPPMFMPEPPDPPPPGAPEPPPPPFAVAGPARLDRLVDPRGPFGEERRFGPGPPFPPPPPPDPLAHRLALLDRNGQPLVGRIAPGSDALLRPLRHDGEAIGALRLAVGSGLTDALDLEFQRRQMRLIALAALLALVIALAVAVPLARHLVSPLRALTAGLRQLTSGAYGARARIRRGDEFGELAAGFNQLAETLERNEQLRRGWIADVSHELRTPLAILGGELDALAEGVRPWTPRAVASLRAEARNLNKLVDDLYQLALSDLGALSYRKEPLALEPLIAAALERRARDFAAAGLRLEVALAAAPALVLGDAGRLTQLFDNLLENSLRYTDAGGLARLTSARAAGEVNITLCDTAPGVPEAALPRLFERLYRVDASRGRARGGAGLGLAICANIVAAHGGRIQAQAAPLGGLAITVALPALARSAPRLSRPRRAAAVASRATPTGERPA